MLRGSVSEAPKPPLSCGRKAQCCEYHPTELHRYLESGMRETKYRRSAGAFFPEFRW